MFKTIKNALKTPEVRKKLLYTLLLIVVFRFGCFVTVPGVDTFTLAEQMHSATNGVTGLIDTISGGAFSRLSIFAMSITPYITASIVIQLLGMVIPALERLTKEGGEEGRTKINKYTKILTIVLALIEGLGIFFSYKSSGIFLDTSFLGGFITVLSLMTGTALLIWLGEQITNKGIGNGISMLIFVGIVSGLPSGVVTVWNLIFGTSTFSTVGLIEALGLILGIVLLIAAVVFIQLAERRIPIQYANKSTSAYGAQNSFLPIKLNSAGVMPVIFASILTTIPATIVALTKNQGAIDFVNKYILYNTPTGFVLYILLILFFGYFYTFMVMNPDEMSKNLNERGGYIPGIRPGEDTSNYISNSMGKLTLVGSIFLVILAAIPIIFSLIFGLSSQVTIGGTGMLIVVGVAIETYKQMESSLVSRSYTAKRKRLR